MFSNYIRSRLVPRNISAEAGAPSFFQTGEGAFKGIVVLPVQQSGIDICGLLLPR